MSVTTLTLTIEPGVLDARSSWMEFVWDCCIGGGQDPAG